MVYQLNIQTIPLTRRSHLIVRFPVAMLLHGSGLSLLPSGHTDSMPVRLHHIVADPHDLPGLAWLRTQVPGPKVLCAREGEIVTGTRENAAVGLCLMPVTDPKTVSNRLHLDQASRAVLGRPGQPQGKPVLRDTPEGNDHPGKARAR